MLSRDDPPARFMVGLTLLFALGWSNLSTAQSSPGGPQDFPPIKVDVQLVTLTATVEDPDGRGVGGLQKEDFLVYEDRVPQKVAYFQDESVPVSVGIVFDTSGSMVDKIDEVQDAVVHFINTTNPQDEIFLIQFSGRAFLVEDFTGDRQRLRRAIGRLDARGSTALHEAIVLGLEHLQGGRQRKKALLVITDGNDTSSSISLEEAVATAQQSEAIVYAIGIGHGERGSFGHLASLFKDTVDIRVLRRFSDATGGRALLVEGAHHRGGVDLIDQACQQAGDELRHQYTLGYYPTNKDRDGSYRRIRI